MVGKIKNPKNKRSHTVKNLASPSKEGQKRMETIACAGSFFRTCETVSRELKIVDDEIKMSFRSKIVPGDPSANLLGVSEHVMNKEISYSAPKDAKEIKVEMTLNTSGDGSSARKYVFETTLTEEDGYLFDKVAQAARIIRETKSTNFVEKDALEKSAMSITEKQKMPFATIENGSASKFLDFQSKTGKYGLFSFQESGTGAIVMRNLEKLLSLSEVKFDTNAVFEIEKTISDELGQYKSEVSLTVERFHQMLKDESREQEEISKMKRNQSDPKI